MSYEVVVVGGGVGGLTAAALLAARGLKVCLLERQSFLGGCVATIEFAGHKFEPTHGLYSGWAAGEVYERLFSTLGTTAPRAHLQSTAYVVRLPDGIQVPRTTQIQDFETHLGLAFPECAGAAIDFYRELARRLGTPPPKFVVPPADQPVPSHEKANRRISNTRMKAELRVDLQYPDFLQGLAASI